MKAGVQLLWGQLTVTPPCFKSLGTFRRQQSDGNQVNHPPRTILRGSESRIQPIFYNISHVQLFATLWTVACKVPQSMGFSRQE